MSAAGAPHWSPGRALIWEFGRLAWRRVSTVIVVNCLLAALFHQSLASIGSQRDGIVFSSLLMTFLIINIMTLIACREDGLALGFEPRLFLLPLPTWMLVLGRLVPALAAVATMQLAVTFAIKGLYGAPWPVIGPALLAMACLAWVLAIIWSFGRWPFLLAPCGLPLVFALQAWLRPRLGPQKLWPHLSAADTLTLIAAIALATWVAVIGVGRARAQSRHVARLRIASLRLPATGQTSTRPVSMGQEAFRTAAHAQLWMEWREKGRPLAIWSLAGLAINVLFASIPHPDSTRLVQAALMYAVFMVLVQPAIVGFMAGRSKVASQDAELDMMRATRPLSDRHLAWTLLAAGARNLVAAWTAMLAGSAVLLVAIGQWGDPTAVEALLSSARRILGPLTAVDCALVGLAVLIWGWCVMALLAAITLSGRGWVEVLAIGPYAMAAAAVIADRALGFDLWPHLLPVVITSLLVVPPVATVVTAWQAIRKQLVPWRVVVRAGCLWLTLSWILVWRFPAIGKAIFAVSPRFDLESILPLLIPAVLTLVVMPVALAPLSLAWNRHR